MIYVKRVSLLKHLFVVATSFGKNFSIFRPTLVVDPIGVDVKLDVSGQP